MTAKELAKHRRLLKTYGWTLEMYNALGEFQEWKCYGCGRTSDRLNVDHEHFKVESFRIITDYPYPEVFWRACTSVRGYGDLWADAKTKAGAIAAVRKKALPLSVRGLLCPGRHGTGCNTKLGRIDDIKWLRRMADYLENPPAKQVLKTASVAGSAS